MQLSGLLEKRFRIRETGSSVATEIQAGLTIFLTMSYIIAVNPAILNLGGKGVPFHGALTGTIIVAALSSILMGLAANLPYALAPGMGLNAFFAFTLVAGMGISWQAALGTVFLSGVLFVILSVTPARELIVHAIPECIRLGTAAGIGLFLALIGLRGAGFIVHSDATMVAFGGFTPGVCIFLAGLALTAVLSARKVPGSLLLGIIITTVIAFGAGRVLPGEVMVMLPESVVSSPDFHSAFLKFDLLAALRPELAGAVFVFFFTDMFDSLSTFLAVAQVGNLRDENGRPRNLQKALLVDALSTTISGISGTSSGTTYVESAAGVKAGGRTGLTAVTAGLLFLPFLFFSPLVKMIPGVATAPVLVMVGFYMMSAIKDVRFSAIEEGFPAFVAMILIPLCYSITQGICWSFLIYTLLQVSRGNIKKISPVLWIIDVLAAAILVII